MSIDQATTYPSQIEITESTVSTAKPGYSIRVACEPGGEWDAFGIATDLDSALRLQLGIAPRPQPPSPAHSDD